MRIACYANGVREVREGCEWGNVISIGDHFGDRFILDSTVTHNYRMTDQKTWLSCPFTMDEGEEDLGVIPLYYGRGRGRLDCHAPLLWMRERMTWLSCLFTLDDGEEDLTITPLHSDYHTPFFFRKLFVLVFNSVKCIFNTRFQLSVGLNGQCIMLNLDIQDTLSSKSNSFILSFNICVMHS